MLNCCIEKKIAREKKENEKSSLSDGIESPIEGKSSDDCEQEEDEYSYTQPTSHFPPFPLISIACLFTIICISEHAHHSRNSLHFHCGASLPPTYGRKNFGEKL